MGREEGLQEVKDPVSARRRFPYCVCFKLLLGTLTVDFGSNRIFVTHGEII